MWKKLLIFGVLFAAIPVIALAWSIGDPLVPCGRSSQDLPNTVVVEGACSLCHLFVLGQNIVDFLTKAIAPSLAVLAFAWAGFKILTSGGSPGARQGGIQIIRNTIIGLLIIFGAWIIIDTLIVFFAGTFFTTSGGTRPWNKITCVPPAPIEAVTAVAYDKEGSERITLNNAGIAVKTNYCTTFDTPNPCTTVAQLPAAAINGLIALKSSCGGSSCTILVTGGTERVGHISHGPNNAIVDLSYESGSVLSTYLIGQAIGGSSVTVNPCGLKYNIPGFTKVLLEYSTPSCLTPNHWHLEF